MNIINLTPKKLTQKAFAPFGNVIEMDEDKSYFINNDMTQRFHNLATIDTDEQNGQAIISIFKTQRWEFPLTIKMLEKHPLGSQAFLPMQAHKWLVIVATSDADGTDTPTPKTCMAFVATGTQGVQYHKNIWHHPLLCLAPHQDFWIIDREGNGNNLVEHHFKSDFAQISMPLND